MSEEKSKNTTLPQPRCILRLPEVERRSGYKRAHIYSLMKQGKFPKNIIIGARAVGWDSIEIDKWVDDQLNVCR